MPGLLGRTRQFDLKYNFEVNLGSPPTPANAAFATCSEISVTTGEATLWQGGSITPYKEPTRLTFADITLERGSSRSVDLYTWFLETSSAAADTSLVNPPVYKRNGTISQKNRMGIVTEWFQLYSLWIKEYSCGDFNNDADEFRIERVVVAYDYFERVPISV
jgi:phage tail-like protein